MANASRTQINSKQLAKMIRASAKRVIASTDINTSTRKGNKELDFVAKRMAKAQPLTPEDAEILGQELGKQVVERSHQLGRKNLDQGVLQQLAIQGKLPTLDSSTSTSTAEGEPDKAETFNETAEMTADIPEASDEESDAATLDASGAVDTAEPESSSGDVTAATAEVEESAESISETAETADETDDVDAAETATSKSASATYTSF